MTTLHKVELVDFQDKESISVCALNPEVRTFNTVYDSRCVVADMDNSKITLVVKEVFPVFFPDGTTSWPPPGAA